MALPPIKPLPGTLPNRSHPRYRGCIAHWLFNEGGGRTIYDLSGWNHHGTIEASMAVDSDWVLGNHGWALEFDDTDEDEFVEIGDQDRLEGLNAITITAWVKLDSGTPNDATIIGKIAEDSQANVVWQLKYESSTGDARFVIGSGSAWSRRDAATSFSTTEWVFLAGTWDGSSQDIYLNGNLDNGSLLDTVVTSMNSNTQPVRIGRENRAGAFGRYWDGKIGEIRIYDRALRPNEIQSLYRDPFLEFAPRRFVYAPEPVVAPVGTGGYYSVRSLQGPPTKPLPGTLPDRSHPRYQGCIGHWLFNEVSGTVIRDVSGRGNTATLTNSSVTGWSLGNHGYTVDLDGNNDYVDCGTDIPALAQPWSMCAWQRLDTGPDSGFTSIAISIYTSSTEWISLGINNDGGSYYLKVGSAGETPGDGPTALSLNTLYFFAVVWDGTNFHAYINGAFEYSVTPSGSGWQTATNIVMGVDYAGRGAGSGFHTDGHVDGGRVYRRPLSPDEILSLYRDPFLEFAPRRAVYAPEPVAAGLSIPAAMHSYRQRRIA